MVPGPVPPVVLAVRPVASRSDPPLMLVNTVTSQGEQCSGEHLVVVLHAWEPGAGGLVLADQRLQQIVFCGAVTLVHVHQPAAVELTQDQRVGLA